MKTMVTRFIVAGLIAVSIGFGLFYFLRSPQPAISTYYQLSDLMEQTEYTTFNSELNDMNEYDIASSINANFKIVKEALDNNFYYYNSYLLFVKNVTQTDQKQMEQKISLYEQALNEAYQLLAYFNDNYVPEATINAGMHQNFLNAYKVQISRYLDLVETLKTYIIRYAFSSTLPVGLKQTLLQVQLDYAKTIMNSNYSFTYLVGELEIIKNKYALFLNAPQGTRPNANNFIDAYANFENLQEYIESSSKLAYVEGYAEGTQKNYVSAIHAFLSLASYN